MWDEAFSENNIDPSFYTERERDRDSKFFLGYFIDIGVTKSIFNKRIREGQSKGIVTPNCRESVGSGCGVRFLSLKEAAVF